jgi:hypothetical protein
MDRTSDPREHNRLASDPGHAPTAAQMKRLPQAGWRAALPPPEKE